MFVAEYAICISLPYMENSVLCVYAQIILYFHSSAVIHFSNVTNTGNTMASLKLENGFLVIYIFLSQDNFFSFQSPLVHRR